VQAVHFVEILVGPKCTELQVRWQPLLLLSCWCIQEKSLPACLLAPLPAGV
jgi:hypothetical protein